MALFCPRCGAATTPGTAFCSSCGAALEALPPQPTTPAAPAPGYNAPALAAAPGVPAARPTGVTAIGVACFVISAFAAFGAIAIITVGSFVGTLVGAANRDVGGFVGSMIVLVALVVLLFAAAFVAVGIGLLRGQDWARVVAIVLAVLVGFGQLGSAGAALASVGQSNNAGSSVFTALLFLAGSIFAVWYLLKPDVRAWFASR